jgi:hypothetical protein
MAITRLGGANAISGTLPAANINSTSLGNVDVGKVLQVVTATHNTQFDTSSTSFVAVTGLEANITPSSTSNKVLILVHFTGRQANAGKTIDTTIYRNDTTNLAINSSTAMMGLYNVDATDYKGYTMNYLDSPSSTSAVNYQVYAKVDTSSTGGIMVNTNTAVMTLMEIAG